MVSFCFLYMVNGVYLYTIVLYYLLRRLKALYSHTPITHPHTDGCSTHCLTLVPTCNYQEPIEPQSSVPCSKDTSTHGQAKREPWAAVIPLQ